MQARVSAALAFPRTPSRWSRPRRITASPLRIVEAVLAVNDNRKRAMARKVATALGGSLRGKTVAVLGLTFKPNTDDMREAPSIPLITATAGHGRYRAGLRSRGHGAGQGVDCPTSIYCDGPYACAPKAPTHW